jgi:hypothetical protein
VSLAPIPVGTLCMVVQAVTVLPSWVGKTCVVTEAAGRACYCRYGNGCYLLNFPDVSCIHGLREALVPLTPDIEPDAEHAPEQLTEALTA